MVLSEIRKHGDVELQSARSLLRERVRRNFQRRRATSGIPDLREEFLKVERFGSCPRRGKDAFADFVANSSKQAAARSCFFANVLDQKGGGRFSVRASDAGKFQFARWIIEESRRDIGQCSP